MESQDKLALARFDLAIEAAEVAWAEDVSKRASWPQESNFGSRDKYLDSVDAFHEYLCGEEARNISRVLFQLKAAPVDTVEKMEALIDAHNEQIKSDTDEREFDVRTGLSKDRLSQAAMVTEGEREILLNAVARHGAGVIHERGYARLLVRMPIRTGLMLQ